LLWAVELLWVSEETSELAKSSAELERGQKYSELKIRKTLKTIRIYPCCKPDIIYMPIFTPFSPLPI